MINNTTPGIEWSLKDLEAGKSYEVSITPTKTDAVHMSAVKTSTDWQFTTEDARTKLKRLYPLTLLECVTSPNP